MSVNSVWQVESGKDWGEGADVDTLFPNSWDINISATESE
jgi:hypothetical protein